MGEHGGFPMSVIVTGFFVTSLAYLVCFCCCVVQFFLRRRNNSLRRARNGGNADNIFNNDSQKNDTLKKRFLNQFRNSLRRFRKNRPDATGSECSPGEPCSICLAEYSGEPAEVFIGYIKGCGHFFHFDCIWKWLESKGTCPLCRQKVLLKEDDVRGMSLKHVIKELESGVQDSQTEPARASLDVAVITIECDNDDANGDGNSSAGDTAHDSHTHNARNTHNAGHTQNVGHTNSAGHSSDSNSVDSVALAGEANTFDNLAFEAEPIEENSSATVTFENERYRSVIPPDCESNATSSTSVTSSSSTSSDTTSSVVTSEVITSSRITSSETTEHSHDSTQRTYSV